MVDVIVVGSGAAGTAAALELAQQGVQPLLLDVGITNTNPVAEATGNLYEYRKRHDSFDLQIGEDFSGLAGVLSTQETVAKLNAPNMSFVTRDAGRLSPLKEIDFGAVQSFALGGLGNAWGAGLYRFVDADLKDFPIRLADLAPYFDKLTQEIGITGTADDLTPFFGTTADLLPPLKLSYNAGCVYRRYRRRREKLHRHGLYVGRPRVAALSVPKDGRPPCDYSNLEFWQELPCIYTPTVTLQKLIAARLVDYHPGVLVQTWEETSDAVAVQCIDVHTGMPRQFTARKLLLAAGAINTARITLQSYRDHHSRLPLLENPILQIPLVQPASIGRRMDTRAFGLVQLNLAWESPAFGCLLQGSLVELTSPMRAEFFGRFPVSARANLTLIRHLLPAMVLMHLYWPAWVQGPSWISLQGDGHLRIAGKPYPIPVKKIGELLRLLRSLGLWTHSLLIQQPVTGHAIHYAGTLPMHSSPGQYQCHPSGKLQGTQRVFVADSASFSSLSAKNMSLGMMANAMRIAGCALQELRQGR